MAVPGSQGTPVAAPTARRAPVQWAALAMGALSAAVDSYLALRPRLAAERGMPLAEPLAQQVLGVLR